MLGVLGSRSGSDLTSMAAVSAILWIWDSTRTGVSCRGEVGGPGGSPLCNRGVRGGQGIGGRREEGRGLAGTRLCHCEDVNKVVKKKDYFKV